MQHHIAASMALLQCGCTIISAAAGGALHAAAIVAAVHATASPLLPLLSSSQRDRTAGSKLPREDLKPDTPSINIHHINHEFIPSNYSMTHEIIHNHYYESEFAHSKHFKGHSCPLESENLDFLAQAPVGASNLLNLKHPQGPER